MFKEIEIHSHFNERTGYGVHASRFFPALNKLTSQVQGGSGTVHISLLDVVTAAHTTIRQPYPSILYTVWESTEYPAEFMDKIRLYDQLWVPSEWQRACSIAQGIPEEFVKVVPEGVDPETYKPTTDCQKLGTFDFLHVGQWQPRKSTKEIVETFLKAFPDNSNVRLYLSTDTLFPSDTYKSTEERLVAHGLSDPRIIPVHFEPREDYIRRLQSAHCFVTCARSEGWNLPLIEGIACGIPSITSDFGGSIEYAGGAIVIPIKELKKPFGIYGNWDVPGKWGEPDYELLAARMKDVYNHYSDYKQKAMAESQRIRTQFSWNAAAIKAFDILEQLSQSPTQTLPLPIQDPEKSIRSFARSLGYEIQSLSKRSAIFTVDCHPDTKDKMETLLETLAQIKQLGYPVLVSSHLALPQPVIDLVDYYIYDKSDPLGDKPVYWRTKEDGTKETKQCRIPCHALAAIHNVRNAIDFCLGKYDWIYHMSSDAEIDLEAWLKLVHASEKELIAVDWNREPETFGGQIIAAKTHIMDKIILHIPTWKDFVRITQPDQFCSERWLYRHVVKEVGLENVEWLKIEIGNRYDQVDRTIWNEDTFRCTFVSGARLDIAGGSENEYQVTYSNPIDGSNEYSLVQKPGMWSSPAKKFYRDWSVTVALNNETKFQHTIALNGTNVLCMFGSKALGDTLAWIPYVEEFRKKHGCKVYCSTWWNTMLNYPEIEFILPGTYLENIYATYEIGCFDSQPDKNPIDWRQVPLQKVAADILGIDYVPIPAKLKVDPYDRPKVPYICFSEYSSMKNKLWNRPGAWQKIIDYCVSLGYECVCVSTEQTVLNNVTRHTGQPIEMTVSDLAGAVFYIGLNHGPAWVAYSLGIPCIMITGVSEPFNDFPNSHRIAIDVCRPGCFNDPSVPIARSWEWCNRNKDYACTKEITEAMVISHIDQIVKEVSHATQEGNIKSHYLVKRKGNGKRRPSTKTSRGSRPGYRKEIGSEHPLQT